MRDASPKHVFTLLRKRAILTLIISGKGRGESAAWGERSMKCPYCGQRNSDNARLCTRCGKRLDRVREKRKEKRILAAGVVLVLLILFAGAAAIYLLSRMMQTGTVGLGTKSASQVTEASVTPEPTQKPTPEPTQEPTPEPTPEPTQEPEPTPEIQPGGALRTKLAEESRAAQLEQEGYAKLKMSSAEASSQIYQAGVDNSPYVLYDGQDWSSWQDGVEGEGIGENITLTFDGEHAVRFIKIRLGNWYGDDNYYYEANNRPENVTFELGEESFSITFPDEKKEHIVELSKDITASQMKLTIDSVYKGSIYDDTCINEVTIYGK